MRSLIIASLALALAGDYAHAGGRRRRANPPRNRPTITAPGPGVPAGAAAPARAPIATPTAPKVAPSPARGKLPLGSLRGIFARRQRPTGPPPPFVYGQPASAASVAQTPAAAPPAPALTPAPAPVVATTRELGAASAFDYTADGRTTPPYYVTLDESGRPVTKPWMERPAQGEVPDPHPPSSAGPPED